MYHNQGSQQATDIGTIDFTTGGFDMPVCFHEAQYLKNFVYSDSWNFPMVCGDHTGDETATFLKKACFQEQKIPVKYPQIAS